MAPQITLLKGSGECRGMIRVDIVIILLWIGGIESFLALDQKLKQGAASRNTTTASGMVWQKKEPDRGDRQGY